MNMILAIVVSVVAVVILFGGVLWLLIAGYSRLMAPPNVEHRVVQYNRFMEMLQRVQRAIAPGAREP